VKPPTIIERPSTAAKGAPFCDNEMRSVATAIEGAAPHSPAKLFGRNMSPSWRMRIPRARPQETVSYVRASFPPWKTFER
jgi:hypothetical protein